LAVAATIFVPSLAADGKTKHETTVHTTQGELNFADPLTTHTFKGEPTPGQLAEAAAASAFGTFTSDTPLTASSTTDTIFAPKISSTDVYSTASSPTGQYENAASSSTQDTTQYESTIQSKVFGGQDTSSSSTKKHPKEDLFNTDKTR
jgi:hypothetical protein